MWKFLNPLYFRKTGTENDVVLENIDNILEKASKDSMLVKDELSILTATGEYLDEWGSWFGIRRADGEEDEQYRRRMLSVMSNPKSTIPAIEETIRSYFNNPDMYVKVYEPHKNIKIFNISTFSGPDKFQSDDYWRHSVIDIHLKEVFIDEQLKSSIKDVKSAGIGVYYTIISVLHEDGVLIFLKEQSLSLEREVEITPKLIDYNITNFSELFNEHTKRSGIREIYRNFEIDIDLGEVSAKGKDNEIYTNWQSLSHAGRSSASFRSGLSSTKKYNGSLSGYKLSSYDYENPLLWGDDGIVIEGVEHLIDVILRLDRSSVTITVPLILPKDLPETPVKKIEQQYETHIRKVASGKLITAGSSIVLADVQDITVGELAEMTTELYVGEPEVITESV